MDIFKKVDLAIEAMKNAAEKTEIAAPMTNEELDRANALLAEVNLPPLPEDFMYLLRKGSAYKGPYFDIYGMEGMHSAKSPEDIALIGASLNLIQYFEDDDDPKGLMLGYLCSARMIIVYKNGKYYQVEDDRGVYSFFGGIESLGDFLINEIRTTEEIKLAGEVEKWSD